MIQGVKGFCKYLYFFRFIQDSPVMLYSSITLSNGNYSVRPEDVKDDPEFIAAHQDTKFKSTIRVYELLGAEVNLHYEIGDVTCTAKVNPRTTARPGDEVEFAMDVARLHVFDKETEMVITH